MPQMTACVLLVEAVGGGLGYLATPVARSTDFEKTIGLHDDSREVVNPRLFVTLVLDRCAP